MPNFKKSNKGYMMKPKGMGQQGYAMMGGQDPKKKSTKDAYGNKQGSKASKLAKGIRDFHIGAAGLIGPGGAAKGLKGVANIIKSGGKKLFKAFTNAPKQYMKPYKVDGKLYGHFDKSGKLTNKYVPVVGKPGKTVKVKNPKTKSVSYVNPRISMTAAERAKAGY